MIHKDWEPIIINKFNNNNINKNNNNNKNEDEDEDEKYISKPKISLSNSKLIQTARNNLNLSQNIIAKQLNIDCNIYKKYESGQIIPEYKILLKLEKILKIKLNKKKNQ